MGYHITESLNLEGYAENLLLSQNWAITKKSSFYTNVMKLGQNKYLAHEKVILIEYKFVQNKSKIFY